MDNIASVQSVPVSSCINHQIGKKNHIGDAMPMGKVSPVCVPHLLPVNALSIGLSWKKRLFPLMSAVHLGGDMKKMRGRLSLDGQFRSNKEESLELLAEE